MKCGYTKGIIRTTRTDNAMAKGGRSKRQTIIYKELYRKLKVEQHKPHKNTGVNNHVLRKDKRLGWSFHENLSLNGRIFVKGVLQN